MSEGPAALTDDLAALDAQRHRLFWLGDNPAQVVRDDVEAELNLQAPGAKLVMLRVVGEPVLVDGEAGAPLLKMGVAFPFISVALDPTGKQHFLAGIISEACVQRLEPPLLRTRLFFELGAAPDDEAFLATFHERIDELAAEITASDPTADR